ncbi:FHA domain-containing protein [bacterium]|nr:FHA domain-containing protein [bacterium]
MLLILREYRQAQAQVESERRVYGRLISLQEIDGVLLADGELFPLLPVTRLGRSASNNVVINDSYASSDHAVLTLRDGQWWLEDRQSRNGTTLNDVLVTQPVIMTDGDVIGIGRKRYRLDLDRQTLRKRP